MECWVCPDGRAQRERNWAIPESDAGRTAQKAEPGAQVGGELPFKKYRGPENPKEAGGPGEGLSKPFDGSRTSGSPENNKQPETR